MQKKTQKQKQNIKTHICDNIEHKWQCIKLSIVETSEELLIREKLALKLERITIKMVQDIERKLRE